MKLGQIVQYVLTKDDVQHINARRALDATSAQARTAVIAHGNPIREGDVFHSSSHVSGVMLTTQQRDRIGAAHRGMKRSAETRRHISEGLKRFHEATI